jgi:hypothetical protein
MSHQSILFIDKEKGAMFSGIEIRILYKNTCYINQWNQSIMKEVSYISESWLEVTSHQLILIIDKEKGIMFNGIKVRILYKNTYHTNQRKYN